MAPRRKRPESVLVVYKKTGLETVSDEDRPRLEALIAAKDPAVARVVEAHESHMESMRRTKEALTALGVEASFRYDVEAQDIHGVDLVVTLGGDGTLLWASHSIAAGVPVVAINSAPGSSIGFFCAGDRLSLEDTLTNAVEGRLPATKLTRMQVERGSEVLSRRVLNDVLYCHASPAVTVRYIIEFQGMTEEHRSSGVWAGPAAGSTAAQRSAGGKVLPLASRKLQFVVREPYRGLGTSYQLPRGLVPSGESVTLRSKMRDGRLFLDGAHREFPIQLGEVIRLTASEEPLTMLGLRRRKSDQAEASQI